MHRLLALVKTRNSSNYIISERFIIVNFKSDFDVIQFYLLSSFSIAKVIIPRIKWIRTVKYILIIGILGIENAFSVV